MGCTGSSFDEGHRTFRHLCRSGSKFARVCDDAVETPGRWNRGSAERAPPDAPDGKSQWTGKTQKLGRLNSRLSPNSAPNQWRAVPARLAANLVADREGSPIGTNAARWSFLRSNCAVGALNGIVGGFTHYGKNIDFTR